MAIKFVILAGGFAFLSSVGLAQTESKAAGRWQGQIQIPNQPLGVTLDLARNPKGVWIGSISLSGTTAVDVPLGNISVGDSAVGFTAGLPERTSFDGRLSADAGKLSGTVASSLGGAPFELTRNGEAKVIVPPPSSPLSKEFEGSWEGALDTSGKLSRIGLKLSSTSDGNATATLIVLDQGNQEIPITTVTLKANELQLESRAVSGTYRGTLGPSGEIAGEWVQGPSRLPLTFKRASPEPKKP